MFCNRPHLRLRHGTSSLPLSGDDIGMIHTWHARVGRHIFRTFLIFTLAMLGLCERPARAANEPLDPRDPYSTAASTPPRAFGPSIPNQTPSIPAQSPLGGLPVVVGTPTIPGPASLPAGNFPGASIPSGTTLPGPMPEVPAPNSVAGPVPSGLTGKADWALQNNQAATGLQYLYAAAVIENDAAAWDRVAWNEELERPVVALHWGVGVEGDLPRDANLDEATGGVLPGLKAQLEKVSGESALGKHAAQLVKSLGAGRTRDDLLASARLAGVDVLAEVDLQIRVTPATRRQELLISVYLFDVASGKALWRSEALSRTKFLLGQQQGRNLGLELAAEAGNQATRISRTTQTCPFDPAAARTRCRELVDSKPTQPLSALFQIRYLQRQQKLNDREASLMVSNLVGSEAAQMLASNSPADKQTLVDRWTPKLQGAPPSINQGNPTEAPAGVPGNPAAGIPNAPVPLP